MADNEVHTMLTAHLVDLEQRNLAQADTIARLTEALEVISAELSVTSPEYYVEAMGLARRGAELALALAKDAGQAQQGR